MTGGDKGEFIGTRLEDESLRCQMIAWLVKSPAGNTLVLIPTNGARADLLALEVYVRERAGTSEVELLTVADSVVRFDGYEADFIALNPVDAAGS